MKILPILAIAALACFASADDAGAIKQTYDKLAQAMSATDFKKAKAIIASITTSDFAYYDSMRHKETGEQVIAEMQQMFAMTKNRAHISITPSQIKIKGNTATAMSAAKMTADMQWTDGKTHKMSSNSTGLADLVKVAGVWKLKAVHEKSNTMLMDGKPVKM